MRVQQRHEQDSCHAPRWFHGKTRGDAIGASKATHAGSLCDSTRTQACGASSDAGGDTRSTSGPKR